MGLAISTLHVRRSIFINVAPSRVWEEFRTTDQIKAWLSLGHTLHEIEPNRGGKVRMSVVIDGEELHYGGSVIVHENEREISLEIQWDEGPFKWPVPTLWTIRLTALYDGTHVELFHHGFERMGTEAADNLQGYEQGWDLKHLTALRQIIEQ